MTDNNKYVVGIGEMLWDMLPQGKQLGGAPANFAYHVSQFGWNSMAISALGKDALGKETEQILQEKHLPHYCQLVDFPTGTVQVTLDAAGVPAYEIKETVAWDNIPFTDEMKQLAQNTSAVCFGSLAQRNSVSRNTICSFLQNMPDGEGIYKVFDINLRQHFYNKEILEDSMQKANVLKINDEELAVLCQLFEYTEKYQQEQCLRLLNEYQLDILILTCGTEGSAVLTRNKVSFIPTPQVVVADTVGAGDSFTAAFIAALLKGKDIAQAHQLAVEVSAYVCTQHGAMPTLPEAILKSI